VKKIVKYLATDADLWISGAVFIPISLFTSDWVLVLSLYGMLVLLLGPLTYWCISTWEGKYPVFDHKNIQGPILVLGGGHTPNKSLPPSQQLDLGALGRMMEGIRLVNLSGQNTLIMSGCTPCGSSQAALQTAAAISFGLPGCGTIRTLDQPTTTEEEAISYKRAFSSISPVVVTKAIHMPRAILTFEKHDIQAVAAPCNFTFKGSQINVRTLLVPAFTHAPSLGEFLTEIVGFVFIKLQLFFMPLKQKSLGTFSEVK
jgi:uncharacterized SAM-binding protein YcdF (DUF218 family)